MSTKLDLRDVRPLTSSEIAKVLTALLAGVYMADRSRSLHFGHLVEIAKNVESHALESHELDALAKASGLWTAAFLSTASGFYKKTDGATWCYPQDIHAALVWISENLPTLFPVPTPN
jgi:hypothetical protein